MRGLCLLAFALLLAAGCARPRRSSVPPPQFEDVVEFLAPGGVAEPARLTALPRKRAVALLVEAQAAATGERAEHVAYLLALLRHDYKTNRERLALTLASCGAGGACQPLSARYLAELASRGDRDAERALLAAAASAARQLAEPLGVFFADRLLSDLRPFLEKVRKLPYEQQRRVAELAAAAPRRGSSGGLSAAMRRDVMADLERITHRRRDRLKPVATTFLDAFRQVSPEPP